MNEVNYIEEFINYLLFEKKYSSNTINSYKEDLLKFQNYCDNNKIKICKADKNDIQNYIQTLGKAMNMNSVSRNISTLKSFYKFLMLNKNVTKNPLTSIKNPKIKKALPKVLSEEEINTLLDINLNNDFDYRNKAMLELMYSSGLRVSELINLKVNDVDLDDSVVRIFGKGSKERIVPLSQYAVEALDDYINFYRGKLFKHGQNDFLFLNNHGLPMTRQGFFKIIKKYAAAIR